MAKRKSRKKMKMRKVPPLQTSLRFNLVPGATNTALAYVDSFKSLSQVNRKLLRQGQNLAIGSVEFSFEGDPSAISLVELSAFTAGNTWIVQNSWTKGYALWQQMQSLVLEDNPSVKGKWRDFKVQLETDQTLGNTLPALDGDGNPYTGTGSSPNGEWSYSTYVMPQHEVDPVTGLPLDAPEYTAVLIGDDSNPTPLSGKRSLVKAYADSRATVQFTDPNVPAAFSDSFFNLLTDSGSQEPELADVIEGENDEPPYDFNEYPGAEVIAPTPTLQSYSVASIGMPKAELPGFLAQCGLIKFEFKAWDQNGVRIPALGGTDAPFENGVKIKVNYVPGGSKGVVCAPMGQ
jgi:hypothetical protein